MPQKKQEIETICVRDRCSSKQNLHPDDSLLDYDAINYL
jgi:hypothetical protein